MKTSVIGTRLSAAAIAAVRQAAAKRGVTVSTHLGQAIALLSVSAADPDNKLAAVAKLLGLPPDATGDQIIEAIGALAEVSGTDEPAADPLASSAEPGPQLSRLSALSTITRAGLAKRGITTEAGFAQAKRDAMPRSPSKRNPPKPKAKEKWNDSQSPSRAKTESDLLRTKRKLKTPWHCKRRSAVSLPQDIS